MKIVDSPPTINQFTGSTWSTKELAKHVRFNSSVTCMCQLGGNEANRTALPLTQMQLLLRIWCSSIFIPLYTNTVTTVLWLCNDEGSLCTTLQSRTCKRCFVSLQGLYWCVYSWGSFSSSIQWVLTIQKARTTSFYPTCILITAWRNRRLTLFNTLLKKSESTVQADSCEYNLERHSVSLLRFQKTMSGQLLSDRPNGATGGTYSTKWSIWC